MKFHHVVTSQLEFSSIFNKPSEPALPRRFSVDTEINNGEDVQSRTQGHESQYHVIVPVEAISEHSDCNDDEGNATSLWDVTVAGGAS